AGTRPTANPHPSRDDLPPHRPSQMNDLEDEAPMDARDETPPTASSAGHVPVLLDRVLALLGPALADKPAVVVDATLGLGGHAEALLAAHPELMLVGLDRDPAALARSRDRLSRFGERIHLVHAVYDRMPEVL